MSRLRRVFCALFGHARVYDSFMGYHDCARCGQRVGDSLGSIFVDHGSVSCDCSICESNWPKLRWRERAFCKQPEWSGLTPEQKRDKWRSDVAAMLTEDK